MRECFQWLVRHEKLVVAVNFALVIALVGQLKFCKNTVEPETGPAQSQVMSDQNTVLPTSITALPENGK